MAKKENGVIVIIGKKPMKMPTPKKGGGGKRKGC